MSGAVGLCNWMYEQLSSVLGTARPRLSDLRVGS